MNKIFPLIFLSISFLFSSVSFADNLDGFFIDSDECHMGGNENVIDFCSKKAITTYQYFMKHPANNMGNHLSLIHFTDVLKDTNSIAHSYIALDTKNKKLYPFAFSLFKKDSTNTNQPRIFFNQTGLCTNDELSFENAGSINKEYDSDVNNTICFSFDKNDGFSYEPFYIDKSKKNIPLNFILPNGLF